MIGVRKSIMTFLRILVMTFLCSAPLKTWMTKAQINLYKCINNVCLMYINSALYLGKRGTMHPHYIVKGLIKWQN